MIEPLATSQLLQAGDEISNKIIQTIFLTSHLMINTLIVLGRDTGWVFQNGSRCFSRVTECLSDCEMSRHGLAD
jgi:hypothetical protein